MHLSSTEKTNKDNKQPKASAHAHSVPPVPPAKEGEAGETGNRANRLIRRFFWHLVGLSCSIMLSSRAPTCPTLAALRAYSSCLSP
jgi:hypothetical protein